MNASTDCDTDVSFPRTLPFVASALAAHKNGALCDHCESRAAIVCALAGAYPSQSLLKYA